MAAPLTPAEKAKLRDALGVSVPGMAAPAVIGGGTVVATGKPMMWLWNEILPWLLAAGPKAETVPVMPEDVALWFGGVALGLIYFAVRGVRALVSK